MQSLKQKGVRSIKRVFAAGVFLMAEFKRRKKHMLLRRLLMGKGYDKGNNTLDIPGHIAIIPDGNGRWAKRRGLPRSAGHRAGSRNLKNIVKYCDGIGVRYLTVYTFSTENWSRPGSEIEALMDLLYEYLKNAGKELEGTGIRVKTIGDTKGLPGKLREEIPRVEKLTENRKGLTLVFALNYGGRDEIVRAMRQIARKVEDGQMSSDDICKKTITDYLYTAGIPEPDLIIRTSGEMRTSNFLLWQAAYSEYWFSKVLWPDFSKRHIDEAIETYQKRNRRYGGI